MSPLCYAAGISAPIFNVRERTVCITAAKVQNKWEICKREVILACYRCLLNIIVRQDMLQLPFQLFAVRQIQHIPTDEQLIGKRCPPVW